MSGTIEVENGRVNSYVGRDAVEVFRAKVVAGALELYAKTGMRANRAYTPTNMQRVATEITGKKFTGKDKHLKAAAALREWAQGEGMQNVEVKEVG